MENKNRKGLLKKLAYGVTVVAAIISLGLLEKNTRAYEQFNGMYQGDNSGGKEGITFFVFDKESSESRGFRKPEHYVTGNFDLTKKLEIGKEYQVKTMRYGFPFFGHRKIISFNPYSNDF